ncbi:hypothetical protein H5398_03310 [Tessaracoccus sp. MC1679]|uniref:TY-Chap domain-containing protein n=1 Tax=Tessaracoccus sp. MC1679 TaxID=2760313 RepID=UPI0016005449|nr:hypothetical protein [Tessaracoccus sp. MC1679]MBB1515008.1 hypothetical protein [Tessaracoccus sp. MC1679]
MTPSASTWVYFAAVDSLDKGAVLALIRTAHGGSESFSATDGWQPIEDVTHASGSHPNLLVKLTDAQARSVLRQIGAPAPSSPAPPQTSEEDAINALEAALRAARGDPGARHLVFGDVYAQWLDQGPHLLVEVSANRFLPPGHRLSAQEEWRLLVDSPLEPPWDASPNWSIEATTDAQFRQAAATVVWALALFRITPAAIVAALKHQQ